ncbi:hypothetical protein GLGCALEP_02155 [Pseudomonas sp. MM221]|nr:hypothetical protein DBADOPDK_02100 [Pseudomonas sp. MM223]CAI3799145.1 hypothetical protein GLGCALEP_02155 [Pseudomonas sp. MM221]
MKRFFLALALLPALALGAANDIVTNQRNGTDTSSIPRTVAKPPGTQDGIMGFNGATVLPVHWTIGQGLSISSGALVSLPQAWADITGKPTFATVATTGAYADLTGKPALFSGNYADLAGIPATFPPSAHIQAWSTITATPTTLGGYGITDGVTQSALTTMLGSYATTAAVTAGLATKFNTPAGTTTQYVRGDGSLATFPAIPGGTVTSITAGTGLSGGTITTSGTISMPNTGTAGSYANVTTDAQGRVTAGTNRSQSAATRALNTAFQISTTRDAWVSYSVQITVTASISGGQNGDVILEIASDSGFTANVQTLAISGLGQTYTLAIALQGVQPQTGVITGYVPAGYYTRLRTVNNTGTPVFSYRAGQEVLQ